MTTNLKRTPLYEEHEALGGKLVPYAGYEMPVQYPTGITTEHRAVREAAGLFDVSHMGEVEVRGPQARDYVQYITTNDIDRVEIGQAQYSAFVKEDGTVLDDLLIYRFDDHYLLVVNAANRDRDLEWMKQHAGGFDVEIRDRSDEIALLALQGPRAAEILQELTEDDLSTLRYYRFREAQINGRNAIVSRTGYTGEDGFELYIPVEDAQSLWKKLLEVGESRGLIPAGLGARDSLRLEMGFPLYGNDLDEEHTALESGLGWIVKLDKGDFIGRDALAEQKSAGVNRKLTGLRLLERAFPRPGYPVQIDGEEVGTVSSGTLSPMLGDGIAFAYLPADQAKPGNTVDVMIRRKPVPAEIVRPPFYKVSKDDE